jgi:hypothetical protein
MSAAEGAVREEMEAAAVAKSTATALRNVLAELKDIGVSFDNADKLERSLEAKGMSKVSVTVKRSGHLNMSLCSTIDLHEGEGPR